MLAADSCPKSTFSVSALTTFRVPVTMTSPVAATFPFLSTLTVPAMANSETFRVPVTSTVVPSVTPKETSLVASKPSTETVPAVADSSAMFLPALVSLLYSSGVPETVRTLVSSTSSMTLATVT